MKKKLCLLSFCFVCLSLGQSSQADLMDTGPFVGNHSEGFESYPNYHNGGNTDSLEVLGGQAVFASNPVNSDQLYIINPPFATWFLGGNRGMAGTNSGVKALGLFESNGNNADVTLTFDTVASEFGFYFLTADANGSTEMIVSFFDVQGNQLGSDQVLDSGGNTYQWAGWSSATGIKSVRFTGNEAPVLDDLHVNFIPEPVGCVYTAIIFALAISRRHRRMI